MTDTASAHVRTDDEWMRLALGVATRGKPAPNPRVGALVVNQGEAVGFGWHERAGGPHAEVVALLSAGHRARGATLYVTLEPCNHQGRTPPCVDAIVLAELRRVVIASLDPNPRVAGGGAVRLRRHGVDVDVGVLGNEAAKLIEDWLACLLHA
jgi:diaminohydroxyphosphoribosylaminopyrimidine deaminase/5-amino-6-(5-phosphoribosylamino)uracil reductase